MTEFSKSDLAPAYAIADAAFVLRLPANKVDRWATALLGIERVSVGKQSYGAISYATLLQLHVLKAMRIKHHVPLQRIRRALEYLQIQLPTPYPLLDHSFSTDGLDLFMDHDGDILNVSRGGQGAIRELVSMFQSRIVWQTEAGSSFFPFVEEESENEPKLIEMKSGVAFGRPVLVGTGISAEFVAGRFRARDSAVELAEEYQVPLAVIEEAIRWEMPRLHVA